MVNHLFYKSIIHTQIKYVEDKFIIISCFIEMRIIEEICANICNVDVYALTD